MRPADIDWSVMWRPLVALVLALAVGGGVMISGYRYAQRMEQKYTVHKRRLTAIRERYRSVDAQRDVLATYLPRYRELEQEGVIGAEHRLDWIEALRASSHMLKLPSVVYDLSSRQPYSGPLPVTSRSFKVYASEMKLDLGLLHGGDLPNLLTTLAGKAAGFYSLVGCQMSREGKELHMDPTAANIHAECTLRWITIEPPATGGKA